MASGNEERREASRRKDLAEFLRAKRAEIRPDDFGLPTSPRRRAKGLLREELAQICGIGLTWYTWLEQGRDIHVSSDLLQRLTNALRLSPHDAAYLFSLAGKPATGIPQEKSSLVEGLQNVLDGYSWGPAVALDGVGTTLGFNLAGDFIYRFSDYDGPWGDNIFWRLFTDPYRKKMYVDWMDFALYSVGLMRGLYASRKEDSAYHEMVEDLCRSSTDFHRMWSQSAQQGTSSFAPSRLRLQIPALGELMFLSVRLAIPAKDSWALFLSPIDDLTKNLMLGLASRKVNRNAGSKRSGLRHREAGSPDT
jgi:transcriptional regulator with XRE-family HTH domain